MRPCRTSVALAVIGASCGLPEPSPLPTGAFAFGVFGDGPYRSWEMRRFQRFIEDVNKADLQWVLHVGDILWFPCSDEVYADRLAAMSSIRHPVVYTPGDNEWADCHEESAGGFQPLERLRRLRSLFFPDPRTSLGRRPMGLDSQSADSGFTDFVENGRWIRGGFVFATIHMVGSGNASNPFRARSSADDREVARRTAAALTWMQEAFRIARSEKLNGVVLVIHGNPGLERGREARAGYGEFVAHLEELVKGLGKPVLLIHGDTHIQRLDHPLRDPDTGDPLRNFTRLETFGSPDIGWIRVVVDSVAGRIIEYEPRLMRRWLPW